MPLVNLTPEALSNPILAASPKTRTKTFVEHQYKYIPFYVNQGRTDFVRSGLQLQDEVIPESKEATIPEYPRSGDSSHRLSLSHHTEGGSSRSGATAGGRASSGPRIVDRMKKRQSGASGGITVLVHEHINSNKGAKQRRDQILIDDNEIILTVKQEETKRAVANKKRTLSSARSIRGVDEENHEVSPEAAPLSPAKQRPTKNTSSKSAAQSNNRVTSKQSKLPWLESPIETKKELRKRKRVEEEGRENQEEVEHQARLAHRKAERATKKLITKIPPPQYPSSSHSSSISDDSDTEQDRRSKSKRGLKKKASADLGLGIMNNYKTTNISRGRLTLNPGKQRLGVFNKGRTSGRHATSSKLAHNDLAFSEKMFLTKPKRSTRPIARTQSLSSNSEFDVVEGSKRHVASPDRKEKRREMKEGEDAKRSRKKVNNEKKAANPCIRSASWSSELPKSDRDVEPLSGLPEEVHANRAHTFKASADHRPKSDNPVANADPPRRSPTLVLPNSFEESFLADSHHSSLLEAPQPEICHEELSPVFPIRRSGSRRLYRPGWNISFANNQPHQVEGLDVDFPTALQPISSLDNLLMRDLENLRSPVHQHYQPWSSFQLRPSQRVYDRNDDHLLMEGSQGHASANKYANLPPFASGLNCPSTNVAHYHHSSRPSTSLHRTEHSQAMYYPYYPTQCATLPVNEGRKDDFITEYDGDNFDDVSLEKVQDDRICVEGSGDDDGAVYRQQGVTENDLEGGCCDGDPQGSLFSYGDLGGYGHEGYQGKTLLGTDEQHDEDDPLMLGPNFWSPQKL